eukprot:523963-Hanusia_phi.AAC.1
MTRLTVSANLDRLRTERDSGDTHVTLTQQMLPYHPNPLPSCRPAAEVTAALAAASGARAGTHHA